VALYGPGHRFAMTDRGRGALERDARHLRIGPSRLGWDGTAVTLAIEERCFPSGKRIRGTVRLVPGPLNRRRFSLDAAGRHQWQPLSADARVEVELEEPALRWTGRAYLDTNWGAAPLERDFADWDWCRAPLREGAAILYDARRRDGTRQRLALRFRPDGRVDDMPVPEDTRLPRTRWGIRRATQGEAQVERTLEDTPFYARSVLRTHLDGEDALAVHESLDLDRFAALPIQLMLPFRVPRAFSRS
jgi:carotenoid 1,2-hydratase